MKFGIWTANAPALLLLIPCSCIAPGLLLACSHPAPGLLMVYSCPPQFGSLHHHHQHITTFFGTARAAFYIHSFNVNVSVMVSVDLKDSKVLTDGQDYHDG